MCVIPILRDPKNNSYFRFSVFSTRFLYVIVIHGIIKRRILYNAFAQKVPLIVVQHLYRKLVKPAHPTTVKKEIPTPGDPKQSHYSGFEVSAIRWELPTFRIINYLILFIHHQIIAKLICLQNSHYKLSGSRCHAVVDVHRLHDKQQPFVLKLVLKSRL